MKLLNNIVQVICIVGVAIGIYTSGIIFQLKNSILALVMRVLAFLCIMYSARTFWKVEEKEAGEKK